MAKIQAPTSPSLIALFAALLSPISACSASPPSPSGSVETANPSEPAPDVETGNAKTPDSDAAVIYLVALEGQPSWQRARNVSRAEIIGCNDYLVPVTVNIPGGSPEARAEATMNKLLSLAEQDLSAFGYQSSFSPSMLKASVERKADGRLVIDLKGTLTVAGVCAVPRMKYQIDRTAVQFGRVSILVNGSEAGWRCFGDESGRCE